MVTKIIKFVREWCAVAYMLAICLAIFWMAGQGLTLAIEGRKVPFLMMLCLIVAPVLLYVLLHVATKLPQTLRYRAEIRRAKGMVI